MSARRSGAGPALVALALLLAGCGFHLRGAADLPFSSLYLGVSDVSPLGNELKRTLRASDVRIVESREQAEAVLQILSEQRERQIIAIDGRGRVKEYQLRYRVAYQVTGDMGRVLVPPTQVVLFRDISFNDEQVLAKENEEALLYRDMQSDAVRQLLLRLQAQGRTLKR